MQARLVVPKRRADWRLGRWTAKVALSVALHVEPSLVSILAAEDGAPEVFVGGLRQAISLSISHRAGVGLAAVGRDVVVGGDLELIEPRSPAFVSEWFGAREQESIAAARDTQRHHELTCLLWSVKEASAKVPPLAPHPQEFPPEKLAYSIKEAAAAVGVGRTTLWKAITEERLLAVKLGTRTLIPSDALRAWIGSLPATRG